MLPGSGSPHRVQPRCRDCHARSNGRAPPATEGTRRVEARSPPRRRRTLWRRGPVCPVRTASRAGQFPWMSERMRSFMGSSRVTQCAKIDSASQRSRSPDGGQEVPPVTGPDPRSPRGGSSPPRSAAAVRTSWLDRSPRCSVQTPPEPRGEPFRKTTTGPAR